MCGNYNFCISPSERNIWVMAFFFWGLSNFINEILTFNKIFKFKNFINSQNFIIKVGEISENENHHPDILFGWGYAKIMVTTHAIEGLSENDFILAAKIDQTFNAWNV